MHAYRPPVQPGRSSVRLPESGGSSHWDPVLGGDVVHVLLVPVLHVRDDHVGSLLDACVLEL